MEQINLLNLVNDESLATHSWESHEVVYLTRKHKRTIKFEEIQMKSSSLGALKEDNRKKKNRNWW